ncbi:MBL fold metallo-hydrolase [Ornithinibacillus californiensis]|uniref:MBL fold metallo-hydrolase n=1 Tax=Ornithinibacillus californiensis TaxID=161536 RepID=UPI00064D7617|nr:MBL fold metallo-hydrolase [Ornithinibacillus californiensis]
MNIKQFSLGPLGTNCYIIYKENKAIIIDPGGEANKVIQWLSLEKIEPIAILLTHAHFDHIGAVDELRHHYHIKVYMHREEASWLMDPSLNRSTFFIGAETKTDAPDYLLETGGFSLGPFDFEVIYTPGHSPGSISFLVKEEHIIFSGDVLFYRGIGRTDLPGGDYAIITDSIQNKLYKLEDETVVYPGHGPKTVIGEEKLHNPFVSEK